MPPKPKASHNLNGNRAKAAGKSSETLKGKTVVCNEKVVHGTVVELKSFQGLVEFKIQQRMEKAPFFKNRVLVNGNKPDNRANLMDIMEVGAKVKLKVKSFIETGKDQHFKILELEYKDQCNSASTRHSFPKQNNAHKNDFSQMKLPYIDGASGTVVNILSDSTGIIFTDPDDDGGCKVFFEINNLFVNGEQCKPESLSMCLHLGQSVYCTATKDKEKKDAEYKAFAVWVGKRPLFNTILNCFVPKMKIKNLTKANVCHGTVKLLAPPKAAILVLDTNNYAVMFITYLQNIKPDEYGWIGDYVQVGDSLLVELSGYYHNLCFAVSKAWRLSETGCKDINKILGKTAEESFGSNTSSFIALGKSSSISYSTFKNVRGKDVGLMPNITYSTSESAENNKKSPHDIRASHLFQENNPQKMTRTILYGRTGKVVSYSTKSRGLLLDSNLGYVKFHKPAVVFPADLVHMDLQEYIPIGSTVYYNSLFIEKNKNYVCTKLWIGRKDKQTDFQSRSLITKCPSTAVAVKTKKECMSTLNGKLTLVTSDRGEISREFGKTVFFSNRNAFLFEINLSQMDLQKVFIEGETLNYILPEDCNATYMEASKVWYDTVDSKETLNQRIDALIGYWMKRGLEKPALRTMIKELKRQHAEQNLQILPKETEFSSMYAGDNLSCISSKKEQSVLNKGISNVEQFERQKAEQNLQIVLRGAALNILRSKSNNLSNVCSDRDLSVPIKERSSNIAETEDKVNSKLPNNDTQHLMDEEATVHSKSLTNKLSVTSILPFSTECGKQQDMVSMEMLASRELSTLTFENKQLPALSNLEQKVLHSLLNFLKDSSMSTTVLQVAQIWLKAIHQKYNDEETETSAYLLQQIGIGSGRGSRQLSLDEDRKSRTVNLSKQKEFMKASGPNKYKSEKERHVAVNQNSYKDCSVKSRNSKCVDTTDSDSGTAQYLLNKASNDASEMLFHDGLQPYTKHMNKRILNQKKYANKEVQTISTGDILYFKVAPDM